MLIGLSGTNFSDILIKIQIFSFTKMHLKISSAKRKPFCPWGDELSWPQSPKACYSFTSQHLTDIFHRQFTGWSITCCQTIKVSMQWWIEEGHGNFITWKQYWKLSMHWEILRQIESAQFKLSNWIWINTTSNENRYFLEMWCKVMFL